ncbi:MAG: hypothetical protein QM756_02000 [Polyangiaceae bacterium]
MANAVTTEAATHRAELRARLFLRAVLPLLETVIEHSPEQARPFRDVSERVRFSLRASEQSATLCFGAGALRVLPDDTEKASVDFQFPDVAALNRFFSGGFTLPRVVGLSHPLLIAKVLRLLLTLQVLKPGPAPSEAAERALRVRLVLRLISRALCELHWGGFAPMCELVEASPERVYQWSVEREGIAMWLRMQRGKVQCGDGVHPHRAPFVLFSFPDVDAALRVFGSSEHMTGVRDGSVQTFGSPEYTRKVAHLMQCMDQLLMEG